MKAALRGPRGLQGERGPRGLPGSGGSGSSAALTSLTALVNEHEVSLGDINVALFTNPSGLTYTHEALSGTVSSLSGSVSGLSSTVNDLPDVTKKLPVVTLTTQASQVLPASCLGAYVLMTPTVADIVLTLPTGASANSYLVIRNGSPNIVLTARNGATSATVSIPAGTTVTLLLNNSVWIRL